MRSMTTEQALAEVRRAYMDAFNPRDADAVAALHTSETVHMPAGEPQIVVRSAIRELMAAGMARMREGLGFEFEAVDVRVAGAWAIGRGVTFVAPQLPAGKYVMMYERDADDHWRIAWTITNSDAPP